MDAARRMAAHAAMVDRMDEQIGRVIQYLEQNGELGNTLIFFTSDNGVSAETRFDRTKDVPAGPAHSFRALPLGFCNAVNAPYRKYKCYNANGGICSPLIAFWPDHILAGNVEHRPLNVLDLMPTLLEVADVDYPTDLRPLDRKSAWPLLTGGAYEPDPMFFQLKYASVDQKAVVQWPWKAWFNGKEGWSLYRLDLDGAETTDLKVDFPERLDALIQAYDQFDASARNN
jgi:arylsulfatase